MKSLDEVKENLLVHVARNNIPENVKKILSTSSCRNCESETLQNTSPGKVTYQCPTCEYIHFLPLRKIVMQGDDSTEESFADITINTEAAQQLNSSAYLGTGTLMYLAIEVLKDSIKGDEDEQQDSEDEDTADDHGATTGV